MANIVINLNAGVGSVASGTMVFVGATIRWPLLLHVFALLQAPQLLLYR